MWKANVTILLLFVTPSFLFAQAPEMAQRMKTCTATCHGPSLIAQQRLDREAWGREVEKMIRWGAVVPAAEKEAFVNYLASLFNPARPRPASANAVPEGKGSDVFQTSCLNCHDDKTLGRVKRDRTTWDQKIDNMANWGAYVPAERKTELIEYLMTAF